jgi:predicted DNA-binding protein
MPLSLRIPLEKEELIRKAATKAGKSKTSFIVEAIDEKLGLHKSREQIIREMAGWMTHQEAEELRQSVKVFERINEEDWV